MLIPKGGDLNDANNWRPITITSVWSRVLHRILVGRFSHLPLCPLQFGFREVDGCLSNAIVLQAITKTARKLTSPYCILALDLAKAFDTIQHTAIRRALQRFRVHGKTIEYIMQSYNGATTTIQVGRDPPTPSPSIAASVRVTPSHPHCSIWLWMNCWWSSNLNRLVCRPTPTILTIWFLPWPTRTTWSCWARHQAKSRGC